MADDDGVPEGIRQHRYQPPPGATRLLLVRHGESAPAVAGQPFPLRDGHGDPPLHPEGHRQAHRLGERLAAEEPISAIYVTTLQRTLQTAAPLAARLGLVPIVEADLREVFLGAWEGGELRHRAVAGDPVFAEVIRQERWDVIPGAEPLDDFNRRLQRGVRRIVAAQPDSTIVVVVHGGVIAQLLAAATSTSGFAFAGADNGSISELVVTPEQHVLRRFNDCAHLSS